jgi:hypothetical protein
VFHVFILIKRLFFYNFFKIIPRKVSAKGKPQSLSGMKVMGIRNCVSVRLSATEL